jgi:hypothetical protein
MARMGFLFGLQLATGRMVPNSRPAERAALGRRVFYEIVSGDSRLSFASPSRGGGSGMGFAGVGGVS